MSDPEGKWLINENDVESCVLLQRMSNTRERTIKTRTVEMQEKELICRENGKRNGRWEVLVKL